MNENTRPHRIVDLSPERRLWLRSLEMPRPKHCMVGLLEADVTVARRFIAEHKARTGGSLHAQAGRADRMRGWAGGELST